MLALAACGPTGLFAGPPDPGGMTLPLGPASTIHLTVAAGAGCRTLTTRLTGLARGHVYSVWLEVVVRGADTGAPLQRQVGAEPAVTIR